MKYSLEKHNLSKIRDILTIKISTLSYDTEA